MALWVRHWDEASAHEYFVHTETGESRWEPPDEFEAAPAPDHAPASPLNAPAAAGDDDDYDEYDYDAPRGYDPPTSRSSAAVALFRQATSPDDASDDASDVAPGSLAEAPAAGAVEIGTPATPGTPRDDAPIADLSAAELLPGLAAAGARRRHGEDRGAHRGADGPGPRGRARRRGARRGARRGRGAERGARGEAPAAERQAHFQ